jgi:predicted phage-related endonuclease
MIVYTDPQGSPEWHEARRGVITASCFKTCRERKKTTGDLMAAGLLYAMDTARERLGGKAQETYQNAAMRFGTEQEPIARAQYEAETGSLVYGAGFMCTDDRKFGCSVDGLVGDDGMVEIKTMVSSERLFTAAVDGDVSEYIDQINGCLWVTGRKWCDLITWAPDMPPGLQMTVRRIVRDDDAIEALEADLIAFEKLVSQYEAKLAKRVAEVVA